MKTGRFDVFLSHKTTDKPAVRQLAQALLSRGLKVWLDEIELIPGKPWQDEIEKVISTCAAAIVAIGRDGIGPWSRSEMRACISQFVERQLPVIPVLLPNAPKRRPTLPLFLREFTWIDLREGVTSTALDRLSWGITGQRSPSSGLRSIAAEATLHLSRLSSLQFQALIVEPLLRQMGLTHVQQVSVPAPWNKLVAVRREFDRLWLYSIMIAPPDDAAFAMTNTSSDTIRPLSMAAARHESDPVTGARRAPDRCYLFAPHKIDSRAAEHLLRATGMFSSVELTVVDADRLLSEFHDTTLTDIVAHIGDLELQYRFRLAEELNTIHESLAFGLREPLRLDDIYVSMSVEHGTRLLDAVVSNGAYKGDSQLVEARSADYQALYTLYSRWVANDPPMWIPARRNDRKRTRQVNLLIAELESKRQAAQETLNTRRRQRAMGETVTDEELARLEKKIGALEDTNVVEIDFGPLAEAIKERVNSHLSDIRLLAAEDVPARRCTTIVREGIGLANDLRECAGLALVRTHWPDLFSEAKGRRQPRPKIRGEVLLKVNASVLITGGPGSGKSTLVKRLGQLTARDANDTIPVVVSAIRIRNPSVAGLIEECLTQLRAQGRPLTDVEFSALARSGRCRLFVDGLDESGSRAAELFQAIQVFNRKHRKCAIAVTSRDTFSLSAWHDAFQIHLAPFDEFQLGSFLSKWFTSRPTKLRGITDWLKHNNRMRLAASTPIIAAVLCTLYDVDADMPSTEVDLYRSRFELLLGRWEQAKGISSMPSNYRERYWHLLMKLAFRLHSKEARTVEYVSAVKLAEEYCVKPYHGSAEGMIIDCVHRGLLEQETAGGLSFGHLTYQEFLAARWLVQQNPISFIWDRLLVSWWSKVIDFYAALKQEVTLLVQHGIEVGVPDSRTFERVCALAERLAPLTPRKLVRKLKTMPRAGKASLLSDEEA